MVPVQPELHSVPVPYPVYLVVSFSPPNKKEVITDAYHVRTTIIRKCAELLSGSYVRRCLLPGCSITL